MSKVTITDRDGWRKDVSVQKAIVYIGSDPNNDVVLDGTRGTGVAPRHVQLLSMSSSENGSWLIDGMVSVVEFKDKFEIASLPEEGSGAYQTLAGFVMFSLGKMPAAADHFEWNGLRFEVVDMDGNKIDKVLVAPVPQAEPKPEPVE